ncbi:helix-turn-helix transcriptional regulator [Thermomonospora amylolytica]|uniref:helix-turn-helix transcriptional regulator n=1 Tax=Thermomonospora amylolytica TaxID=1411117 RepID=UPI002D78FF19|nr:helix-turn-helix domain-containing protein [Thermomonospora amylolytica]
MTSSEFMTTKEVLALLGGNIDRNVFYRWRATGRAPAGLKLPNGDLRFRRSEIYAWLESLERRNAAA